MRKKVDVLVVGLGPAGGAAALAAAQAGLCVAAVERRREVGVPVQCAELVPLALARYAGFPGVLRQRTQGMTIHLPSGRVEKSQSPGLMVNRAAFDQALARRAEHDGAELHLGSRLVELDGENSSATVATPEGKLCFNYRLLIAADGPHSFVAHSLGLPRLAAVHARQYTVPLSQAGEDAEIWLSPDYPGGYAWLFPKGEVANLGVGVDKRLGANPKALLDALHRKLFEDGRVGEGVLGRTGGEIPVGGLRPTLVVGNVLFVGDAAGLTHPITGAGIANAVISGELAGQAAEDFLLHQNASAFIDFEEELRDRFGVSHGRAVARRARLARHRQTPLAGKDWLQRQGWVSFPEYYQEPFLE